MANLITLLRLLLLFLLVVMAYWAPPALQLLDAPLLVLIIALDGLDGWVARRRGETSVFGSIFDIAADRVVENVLWIVLSNLQLIPVWVAIVFVARGAMVDSIRYASISRGETPFGLARTPLARLLVASRWTRGAYGAVKAATFGWVLMMQPWPALFPEIWAIWSPHLQAVATGLVLASVLFCVARGLPVITQFLIDEKVFARAPMSAGGQ
jgi:CDP-diacylglycerol---glycerol-3-phosphate 3-phosphatidyltransferase